MRPEAIQMVRDRVTTKDLCHYLNLPINRSGYVCCPFHSEKTASLKVYDDPVRGWRCFGCGEGGDVIDFARKYYGFGLTEAVQMLAEEFNVDTGQKKLTKIQKAKIESNRLEKEEKKQAEQAKKEAVEADYWTTMDEYNENERILNEQDPSKLGYISEEFAEALVKRDELRFNREAAEDSKRMLHKKSAEEPKKPAVKETRVEKENRLLSEVKSFTAEDYESLSGAPFKWLIQLSDEGFLFTQMKGKMADAARAVGIKNFGARFKAYCDSLANSSAGFSSEKHAVTQFGYEVNGVECELQCGKYICNESGIFLNGLYEGLVTVCSHPIMPVKRLVDIDTNKEKMEIAFKRGISSCWRRVIFDKDTLANSRSITTLAGYGVSVTSTSASALTEYLEFMESANFDSIPVENTTDHLGWVQDYGFAPYIENIVYDNSGRFDKEFRSVNTVGSYEEWLKLARQVRAGDSIPARILLAASFASVLVAKLDALPFIVHLWGNVSGIGKSVALMLAASVWANPDIGNGYVKQMNATAVGMEQSAAFCCNLPLCLDELQLIQDRKNFDQMVYMLCEGATKTRGARNGGLQKGGSWKNCIITTGEMPITSANSKSGAVNRVIEVECTKPTFANAVEASRIMKSNYGWAGKAFVQRLQEHSDAMDVMRDVQEQFYEELQGKATDKQILSASVLLTADYLANLYIFDDNNSLEVADIEPYLVSKEAANTNKKAYDFLCEWIVQNTNKFKPTKEDGTYVGECWGCFEEDKDGEPHTCCIIKSRFDEVLSNAGYNPASFLSWAGAEKMIRTDGGHNTKLKRIMKGSAPVRCVFLKLDKTESDEAEKRQKKEETKKLAQTFLQPVDVGEELPW